MQVIWGLISMVDAEKRLLANALEDVDNQFFVLLSDRFCLWLWWLHFDPFFFIIEPSLLYFTAVFHCIHLIMCIITWWERTLASLIGKNTGTYISKINLNFFLERARELRIFVLREAIWKKNENVFFTFFLFLEHVHISTHFDSCLPLFSIFKFQGSRSTWHWKVFYWDVSRNWREGL